MQDEAIRFERARGDYRHWKLDFPATWGGAVARLSMDVDEDGGMRPGYPLKLNSYDLGVDIELADILLRLRFEHPAVRALIVTSAKDRIFSAGANIYMLGLVDAPLQGQLLQVHQRDAAVPGGAVRALGYSHALRAQRHGLGRRLRAGRRPATRFSCRTTARRR
jgi:hypothetical protein